MRNTKLALMIGLAALVLHGCGDDGGGGSKKRGGCACNTAGASSPSGVLVLIVGLALVLGRRARAFASLLAHDPPRTARTTTAPAASMAPHIQGSRKR